MKGWYKMATKFLNACENGTVYGFFLGKSEILKAECFGFWSAYSENFVIFSMNENDDAVYFEDAYIDVDNLQKASEIAKDNHLKGNDYSQAGINSLISPLEAKAIMQFLLESKQDEQVKEILYRL